MSDERCVIAFSDWTKRHYCGRLAACEVRMIYNGRAFKWRPACYRHADVLFATVAEAGDKRYQVDIRPTAALREVLDHRADVIELASHAAGRTG